MPTPLPTHYEHEIRVPYADVDQMGFVYYANYLVYFEMARSHLLRDAGLPYARLEQEGVMLPVIEAHCNYMKAAHFDDLLVVISRCTELRGPRLRIEYQVLRRARGDQPDDGRCAEEVLATGHTVHVSMSPDGRVIRPPAGLKALVANGGAKIEH